MSPYFEDKTLSFPLILNNKLSLLVENDECADDARHPADAGKDEYNQEGAASPVDNRQRRKDDGQDNT